MTKEFCAKQREKIMIQLTWTRTKSILLIIIGYRSLWFGSFLLGSHLGKFGSSEIALCSQGAHLLSLNTLLGNFLLNLTLVWFGLSILTWISSIRAANLQTVRTYFMRRLAGAKRTWLRLISILIRRDFFISQLVELLALTRSYGRFLIWYRMNICLTFSGFYLAYFETQNFFLLERVMVKRSSKDIISFTFLWISYL